MPFVIKDVLQHKLNDRQLREIHEKEYSKYVTNLRQQQQQQQQTICHYKNEYYLPIKHLNEIERSRVRNECLKKTEYNRIYHENLVLYQRFMKAGQRTMVDNKNEKYQQNLNSFITKRSQQRSNEYNRIYNDNQILLQRINNVRGSLVDKQQCDNDWRKHISFMKKTSIYPENIDKFVANMNRNEQHQSDAYLCTRTKLWNKHHGSMESTKPISGMPLINNVT